MIDGTWGMPDGWGSVVLFGDVAVPIQPPPIIIPPPPPPVAAALFDDFSNRSLVATYGPFITTEVGTPSGSPVQQPWNAEAQYDSSFAIVSGELLMHHDGGSTNLSAMQDGAFIAGSHALWIEASAANGDPYLWDDRIQTDFEVLVKFKFDRVPSGFDSGGFTDHSIGIAILTEITDGTHDTVALGGVQVSTDAAYGGLYVNDHGGMLASTNNGDNGRVVTRTVWVANDWYWMRMQFPHNPSTIRFKAWRDADGEPGSWDSDQATTSGLHPISVALVDSNNEVFVKAYSDVRLFDESVNGDVPSVITVAVIDLKAL